MPGVALNVPHLVNIVMIAGDLFMAEFMIDEIKNFTVYFKRCPICNQLNAVGLKRCIKCDTSLVKQYWDSEEKING